MNRREFLKNTAAFCAVALMSFGAVADEDADKFKIRLKAEIQEVIKKYEHDPNNESTHRVIEAEINDWAHIHVMSEEIADFNVECFEDGSCLHIQAGFKVRKESEWIVLESVVKS